MIHTYYIGNREQAVVLHRPGEELENLTRII